MRVTWRYYLTHFAADYTLGTLALILTQGLGALVPLSIKSLLDQLQQRPIPYEAMVTQLGLMVGLITLMFVARVASRYWVFGVGRKIDYDVRMKLYAHLLKMPRSYFDTHKTGDLMSRLTNDLTALRMSMGGASLLLLNTIMAYAIVLPTMLWLSWPLTLLAFAFYPLGVWLMRGLSIKVKHAYMTVQGHLGGISDMAQESMSAITTVQSYAKESLESKRFNGLAQAYYDSYLGMIRHRVKMYLLMAVVGGLSHWVILGEGGREVIVHTLQISSLVAFMLYLERLAFPTISLGWVLSSIQQGAGAMERINEIFAAPPLLDAPETDTTLQTLPQGALSVEGVWFRYESISATSDSPEAVAHKRPWILQDVSFTVKPGQLVAIVGPVGAGKSTLLHLMVRHYAPSQGQIRIGSTPIDHIPLALLRGSMTLMPQNSFLFSVPLLENLRYPDPDATMPMVEAMAQTAQLTSDVAQMPEGYQTVVGERGVTLSGGQRQRSALVRTLMANAAWLLMDDPFSSVDVETEAAIIEGLTQRQQNKTQTTILVSQRFRWVRQADQIIVLNAQGSVEAVGDHDTLLETCPLYTTLLQSAEAQSQPLQSATASEHVPS